MFSTWLSINVTGARYSQFKPTLRNHDPLAVISEVTTDERVPQVGGWCTLSASASPRDRLSRHLCGG